MKHVWEAAPFWGSFFEYLRAGRGRAGIDIM